MHPLFLERKPQYTWGFLKEFVATHGDFFSCDDLCFLPYAKHKGQKCREYHDWKQEFWFIDGGNTLGSIIIFFVCFCFKT